MEYPYNKLITIILQGIKKRQCMFYINNLKQKKCYKTNKKIVYKKIDKHRRKILQLKTFF